MQAFYNALTINAVVRNTGAMEHFIYLEILWMLFKIPFALIFWVFNCFLNCVKNSFGYKTIVVRRNEKNESSTKKATEIEHFSHMSDWWDTNGSIAGLHRMNVVRIPFFKDGIIKNMTKRSKTNDKPLEGVKLLDVGCGGGFLSEPLARLGATVTGIDPTTELINIAKDHQLLDPELDNSKLTYICTTIEEHLIDHRNYYDVVIASEVIDHINNPEFFVKSCVHALKPGGTIFLTTPNRTWISKFGLIFYAENINNIVPKGTHFMENFITPEELSVMLEKNNCRIEAKRGFFYNFVNNTWFPVNHLKAFYGIQATKLT